MYALRDAIQDLSDHLHRCFCSRIFADDKELEDRRGITKSTACRMPIDGSRQGMMAGPEMVGRGHVASL
jgi:hypothetical protein